MTAQMREFVNTLPFFAPPPIGVGVTEDNEGFLYWIDKFAFQVEVLFRPGMAPAMFSGFCDDTPPDFIGAYHPASKPSLDKLLVMMQETEQCH